MHKWELITLLQCSLIYQVYSLKLSSLNFDWMSCFLKGLLNSLKAFKTTGWGLLSKCSLPGALCGTMRAWGSTGAGTHSRKKVTGAAQRQGTQAWLQLPMKQNGHCLTVTNSRPKQSTSIKLSAWSSCWLLSFGARM